MLIACEQLHRPNMSHIAIRAHVHICIYIYMSGNCCLYSCGSLASCQHFPRSLRPISRIYGHVEICCTESLFVASLSKPFHLLTSYTLQLVSDDFRAERPDSVSQYVLAHIDRHSETVSSGFMVAPTLRQLQAMFRDGESEGLLKEVGMPLWQVAFSGEAQHGGLPRGKEPNLDATCYAVQ